MACEMSDFDESDHFVDINKMDYTDKMSICQKFRQIHTEGNREAFRETGNHFPDVRKMVVTGSGGIPEELPTPEKV